MRSVRNVNKQKKEKYKTIYRYFLAFSDGDQDISDGCEWFSTTTNQVSLNLSQSPKSRNVYLLISLSLMNTKSEARSVCLSSFSNIFSFV